MFGGKNSISREVERINDSIEKLEEKKVGMLREIPFTKWNELTNALQRISVNMIQIMDIKNEINALGKVYEDKRQRDKRKAELDSALREIRERVIPLVEIKNSILSTYSKEFINEIQGVYLEIEILENKKKNFSLISDLVNNPKNFT